MHTNDIDGIARSTTPEKKKYIYILVSDGNKTHTRHKPV